MRLDGLSANPNIDVGQTKTSRPASPSDSTPADSGPTAVATETYQSTGGFDSLVKELQTIPFIRPDAVTGASGRLASGELDGADATDKVVSAILETTSVS